jgi:uncharacterized protein
VPLSIAGRALAGRAHEFRLMHAPAVALAVALAAVMIVASGTGAAAQTAGAPASAAATPPSPTRFVTDGAGFLSAAAEEELERRLTRYERDTGHQVLLWIGQTTGGEPIESWAVRAFAAWRVGRKGVDDGVAVFILAADRRVRIEVGYGVEDRLPDAVAARIIGDEMISRGSAPAIATARHGPASAASWRRWAERRARREMRRPPRPSSIGARSSSSSWQESWCSGSSSPIPGWR